MIWPFKRVQKTHFKDFKRTTYCAECEWIQFEAGWHEVCPKCGSEDLRLQVGQWEYREASKGLVPVSTPVKFHPRNEV